MTSTSPRQRVGRPSSRPLRHFALDGTDHLSHKQQASMIRRHITWRNNHA